jgi:hypothetical protein
VREENEVSNWPIGLPLIPESPWPLCLTCAIKETDAARMAGTTPEHGDSARIVGLLAMREMRCRVVYRHVEGCARISVDSLECYHRTCASQAEAQDCISLIYDPDIKGPYWLDGVAIMEVPL